VLCWESEIQREREWLSVFKKIIEENGKAEKLITDNGSEFTNREFQKLLADSKIFHETNEPQCHPTLGLIDRLCRTIKEKIFKYFTDKNETNWVDHLPRHTI
jgi:transposase InsO family protein